MRIISYFLAILLCALLFGCDSLTWHGPHGNTPDGDAVDGDTPDGDATDGDTEADNERVEAEEQERHEDESETAKETEAEESDDDSEAEAESEREAEPEAEIEPEYEPEAESEAEEAEPETEITGEAACLEANGACWIEGACYAYNELNPQNNCQLCVGLVSARQWTSVSKNTSCDDRDPCTFTDVCDGKGTCAGTALSCDSSSDTCGQKRACAGTDRCSEWYPDVTTVCATEHATAAACDGNGACVVADCQSGYVKNAAGTACVDTWTDPTGGLMWQNPPTDAKIIQDTVGTSCSKRNSGGYTDWRAPSIDELRSLIRGCGNTVTGGDCGVTNGCRDSSCATACTECTTTGGPGAGGCYWPSGVTGACGDYWSSSLRSNSSGTTYGWRINFSNGSITYEPASNSNYLRCVRNSTPPKIRQAP